VLAVLNAFFEWAEGDGALLPPHSNPCHKIKKYTEERRHFVFEGDELYRLSQVLDEAFKTEWPAAIDCIRLYIFTGMRRDEGLTLTWDEVDLPNKRIRLKDAKTGAREVPLGKSAIEVLERLAKLRELMPSPYVIPSPTNRNKHFNGMGKLWTRIRTKAGLPNVRIHDLRHNYGGAGAAATRSAVHVKGLLGHTQLSTTDRYMTLAEAPLSQAADEVNAAISKLMNPVNVVKFGGSR
jgi:integrase